MLVFIDDMKLKL